jgi:hypothetical protein
MRNNPKFGVAAGVFAAVVALPGCASSGMMPDHPTRDDVNTVARTASSEAVRDVLEKAEQVLTRDCMRRLGFLYDVTAPGKPPDDRDFLYVIDDPAWAAQHGYGTDLQRQAERLRQADPNLRYLKTLPPQRQVAASNALNGVGPAYVQAELPTGGVVRHYSDGCMVDAQTRLYGDFGAWYRAKKVTENLVAVRRSRVITDSTVAAALPGWAACMHRNGQPFDTPEAARASLPRLNTDGAQQVEIRRATAEAHCAQSTGLAQTVHAADHRVSLIVNCQFQSELQDLARLERSAIPRATRVLETA